MAVTTFIVVVAAGIGLVYIQQTSEIAGPVDISVGWLTADISGDVETAYQYLADGVEDKSLALLQAEADWIVAIGSQMTLEGCSMVSVGPPAEVHCEWTYENASSNALGVGPYLITTDLVIENEKIQSRVTESPLSFQTK